MNRFRVYLDTSVIGGCLDDEFSKESLALFEQIRSGIFLAIISEVTIDELRNAPIEVRSQFDSLASENIEIVPNSVQVDALTDAYLAANIVTEKYREDAAHIAYATLYNADVLVSWNFRHIVNLKRIGAFNRINKSLGYRRLEIRSPNDLIYG